jgi:hypothetical protein
VRHSREILQLPLGVLCLGRPHSGLCSMKIRARLCECCLSLEEDGGRWLIIATFRPGTISCERGTRTRRSEVGSDSCWKRGVVEGS